MSQRYDLEVTPWDEQSYHLAPVRIVMDTFGFDPITDPDSFYDDPDDDPETVLRDLLSLNDLDPPETLWEHGYGVGWILCPPPTTRRSTQ